MVGKLGGDMNKIASRLNAENGVDPTDLISAYRALLNAVTLARS
jgi:hypothetical protein